MFRNSFRCENISCHKSYQQNPKKEKQGKPGQPRFLFAICTSSGLIGMQNNVVSHYLGHKNSTWEFLNFSTCHWFGSERSTFGPNPDFLGWEAHPKNARHWANIEQIKNLTICLSSLLQHWNQNKKLQNPWKASCLAHLDQLQDCAWPWCICSSCIVWDTIRLKTQTSNPSRVFQGSQKSG